MSKKKPAAAETAVIPAPAVDTPAATPTATAPTEAAVPAPVTTASVFDARVTALEGTVAALRALVRRLAMHPGLKVHEDDLGI